MRTVPTGLRVQARELVVLGVALAAMGSVLLAVVAVNVVFDVEVRRITMDPATSVDFPRYVGAASYVGVVAWFAAATVTTFAASIVGLRERAGRFLASFGALSAWLGVDDLFLVHEFVGRRITGAESGEDVVFAAYIVAVFALVWWWRDLVGRSPALFLVVAGAFFALSIAVDRPHLRLPGQFLLEDGAKLLGISSWAAYGWAVARRFVGRTPR